MIFTLFGIIIGILLTIVVVLLTIRFNSPLKKITDKALTSPFVTGQSKGYIAGLSDEESKFAESLSLDKQINIT